MERGENMITDLEAKRAKPKDRPYMIRDDRGLYLRVDPSARKYWILRYWEARKEHQMSTFLGYADESPSP